MENWEVELIRALREAEQHSHTSERGLAAKWRLVDQALHPHRRWLFWRNAAAVAFLLASFSWVVFRQFAVVNPLPAEKVVTAPPAAGKPWFQAPVPAENGRQVLSVSHPEQRPVALAGHETRRDSIIGSVKVAAATDSIIQITPSHLSIQEDTNWRTRGKRIKRSGSSLYIEGTDSGSALARPFPYPSNEARKKQSTRTGWVTQIRF